MRTIQNKWSKFFLFTALIPVFLQAIATFKYCVNVPYWDQWCLPPIFQKIAEGSFKFPDLLVQQNEHRPAFAFLFSIILTRITDWDVRYEMLFSFILVCIIALLIYRLIKLSLSNQALAAVTFLAASLLIFSPIQAENWVHGIQICVYIALASFAGCLAVSASKYSAALKFVICAMLCTISTFSFANGMAAWIVIPFVLISESSSDMKKVQGKCLILFWMGAFMINLIVYFRDYYSPSWHPSLKEGFYHPLRAAYYFVTLMGNSLDMGAGSPLATVVGGVSMLVWPGLIFFLFREERENFFSNYARWIGMAGFSLISGIIITASRVGFNVPHSLRYTSHSLYFIVSLLCLLAIAIEKAKINNRIVFQRLASAAFSLIFIFVAVMYCLNWAFGIEWLKGERIKRLQGKACLTLSNFVQEKKGLGFIYPDMTVLDRANVIDRLGMLKPPLIKDPDIRNIDGGFGKKIDCGYFDKFSLNETGEYIASGWAVLPDRQEPADAVILTYEDGDGKEIMFNIILDRTQRPDIVKLYQKDFYLNAGWNKNISEADIPKRAAKINAWAFDAESGQAFKLEGEHSLS